ncbi:PREDICTED: GPI-anchored protein LLG1-like isoform X2 [Ipomoea nil]|uniref:GPI-anchored protein LLG1-like isoform X2 n=1 Tax=Ipomoea nil TaxID=35883 RepID=UPI000900B9CD|nr:PREDICTED: GPI-anchored protein LLG1-like isoform X2 [Ipomoea nil]
MVWIKHSSSSSSSSVVTTFSILVSLSLHFLTTFSSSSSDEGSVFVSQYSTGTGIGRNLLQAKIPCNKNFESENYTILTSQCKAPYQQIQPCCDAFTQFACPFAQFLNDRSTNCSDVMFTYIDQKGGFPNGLFTGCKGDQTGLICPTPPPDLTAGVTVGLGAPPPIIQFLFYTTTLAVTFLFLIS